MNRYLTDETKDRLKEKFIRMDSREMRGKVVAQTLYTGEMVAMTFEDGSWSGMEAVEGDEGCPELYPNCCDLHFRWLSDLLRLELITTEEHDAASKREAAAEKSKKQAQLKRLKDEIKRLG